MPPKRSKAKEAKAPYHARRRPTMVRTPSRVMLRWSDIESATEPIVLEKDGQPAAVVIKYADYRRMDAARAERRETAWRELDKLLAQVRARTGDFAPEEIQADITAARRAAPETRVTLSEAKGLCVA